jgi:GMP synthase (glutamine-hydrolysing) A subunit
MHFLTICVQRYGAVEHVVADGMKQVLVVDLYVDPKFKRQFKKLAGRIEEAGGNVATSDFESFPSMDPAALKGLYRGVVLSGTEALYTRTADRTKFAGLIEYLPKVDLPILGICGGHQALALAYGGTVAKSARSVLGYRTINLEDKDTLLAGLPAKIRVMESHKEEVKLLPPGFVRIATSSESRNEGMRHEQRLIYGVQFHPERWNKENQAGKQILENFLQRIVAT